MSRSNKIEMYEREVDIREALSLGTSIPEMLKEMATKWKCAESTIRRQYLQIMEELSNDNKDRREELRNILIIRNDHCYKRALAEGKIKIAIDANIATAKLSGLFNADENSRIKMPEFIETEVKDFSNPIKAVK